MLLFGKWARDDLLILSQAVVFASINTSPSSAQLRSPGALGRKGLLGCGQALSQALSQPVCQPVCQALSQAALELWSHRAERSRAGPGREYKRAALYRSHSRLWSLSAMKNSYKLFPELNHLTSWHLVVFNFVTIGTVHSSQSQFFIL